MASALNLRNFSVVTGGHLSTFSKFQLQDTRQMAEFRNCFQTRIPCVFFLENSNYFGISFL